MSASCSGSVDSEAVAVPANEVESDPLIAFPEVALIDGVERAGFELVCVPGVDVSSFNYSVPSDWAEESSPVPRSAVEAVAVELMPGDNTDDARRQRRERLIAGLVVREPDELASTAPTDPDEGGDTAVTVVLPADPSRPDGPYLLRANILVDGPYAVMVSMTQCDIVTWPIDEIPTFESEEDI